MLLPLITFPDFEVVTIYFFRWITCSFNALLLFIAVDLWNDEISWMMRGTGNNMMSLIKPWVLSNLTCFSHEMRSVWRIASKQQFLFWCVILQSGLKNLFLYLWRKKNVDYEQIVKFLANELQIHFTVIKWFAREFHQDKFKICPSHTYFLCASDVGSVFLDFLNRVTFRYNQLVISGYNRSDILQIMAVSTNARIS